MMRGQTLIEVLIAFAVTVIIGVGLISVGLATQKAAAGARNESQATKLAQEYIENLRVMRDAKGWTVFAQPITGNGQYRINIPAGSETNVANWTLASSSTTTGCEEAAPSVMRGDKITVDKVDFCRKITVSNYSTTTLSWNFKVEVGWKEGNNVRSSRAETVMSLWCGAVITGVTASPCP